MIDNFYTYALSFSKEITSLLEIMEVTHKFNLKKWKDDASRAVSYEIEGAEIIEKGVVRVYSVQTANREADSPPSETWKAQTRSGLHVVLYPRNPMAPAVQMYLFCSKSGLESEGNFNQWFDGGIQLNPIYLIREDAQYFHNVFREVCERHQLSYSDFKRQADKYFWNAHRKEALGIGGIYFSKLKANSENGLALSLDFIKDLGASFIPAYLPILERRKDSPLVKKHLEWQEFRRSRLAEFMLLQDKELAFELNHLPFTNDFSLSVLPPQAKWKLNFELEKGSREDFLVKHLQQPEDWI